MKNFGESCNEATDLNGDPEKSATGSESKKEQTWDEIVDECWKHIDHYDEVNEQLFCTKCDEPL